MKKRSLTLGRRIGLIVAVLVAVLITSTIVNSFALTRTDRNYREVLNAATQRLNGLQSIGLGMAQQRGALFDAVYSEDPAAVRAVAAQFRAAGATTSEIYAAMDQLPVEPSLVAPRALVEQTRPPYLAAADRLLSALESSNRAEAERLVTEEFRPAVTAYVSAQTAFANETAATAEAAGLAASQAAQQIGRVGLGLGIVAGVGGSLLAFFLGRGIVRQVKDLATNLNTAADHTAAAATQVSASSQSLAEGSSEQAAGIEEVSATMEETAGLSRQNTENAARARELSQSARQAVETGAQQMQELQQAMEAIKGAGADISRIIKTIDEIAFQTNILALNAAVEAARAGEAGAGFAVVADEVRSLAQRAAGAARETAQLIETSVTRSEHGGTLTNRVGESLAVILSQVRDVDQLIGQIATASTEQSTGVAQVNTAMSQFDQTTQSAAASAEETASAAEELSAQAAELQGIAQRLTLLVDQRAQASAAPARAPSPTRRGRTNTTGEAVGYLAPLAYPVRTPKPRPAGTTAGR